MSFDFSTGSPEDGRIRPVYQPRATIAQRSERLKQAPGAPSRRKGNAHSQLAACPE